MDKQITALAGGQSGDLLDLLNQPPKDNGAASASTSDKKEEIFASYDFQPIRRAESSPPPPPPPTNLDSGSGSRAWGSGESKFSSPSFRNYVSVEPQESSKFMNEKAREVNDAAAITEIDRTVKKYADSLLSALEGVSSRLSQLESRTRHLETSVDDLKLTIGNNAGSTDGKLRQLENVLREVQTGVQVMRDKQDIAEAHVQLMKIHASSGEQQEINKPPGPTPSQQALQQPPSQQPPAIQQPTLPALSAPPVPMVPPAPQPSASAVPIVPPPSQQNPPIQYPSQVPQMQTPIQNPPYPPPQGQVPEHTLPTYQPSVQQPPSSQYQMPPPPYSQAPQSAQHQPPFAQSSADIPSYLPQQQTYPPGIRPPPPPPPSQQPSGPPPQQFYTPSSNIYEPQPNKQNASQMPFSAGYSPSPGGPGPGFSESHPYGGPPMPYGTSLTKPPPFAPPAPSGGSNYPRLPTAQLLPQATPVASGSSSSSGNRVPIDDVVEKVATMGFSRDQVRATVRKLTENGQSVDLNVVLDKLMNDSETQRSWYGR